MPVDAAVADIQRTGNVYDGSLRKPEAAQHVLGDFEDLFRGQNYGFVHGRTVRPGEGRLPLMVQFCGLGGNVTGHALVEPAVDLCGQIKDFDRHGGSPLQIRGACPIGT